MTYYVRRGTTDRWRYAVTNDDRPGYAYKTECLSDAFNALQRLERNDQTCRNYIEGVCIGIAFVALVWLAHSGGTF